MLNRKAALSCEAVVSADSAMGVITPYYSDSLPLTRFCLRAVQTYQLLLELGPSYVCSLDANRTPYDREWTRIDRVPLLDANPST